jgi:hypothetical protein
MTGSALNTGQRYSAATNHLLECFTEEYYDDTVVLIPLLDSIYRTDDWDSAERVIGKLRQSDPGYQHIGDATVLAYIGAIQIQEA